MPGIGMPGGGGTQVRVSPGSEFGASWERRINPGASIVINIDDANKLFIFGPTATDRVSCLVVR